jgi:hypothetical protein
VQFPRLADALNRTLVAPGYWRPEADLSDVCHESNSARVIAPTVRHPPTLPISLDIRRLETGNIESYAREGLAALRALNPITRDKAPSEVERDD